MRKWHSNFEVEKNSPGRDKKHEGKIAKIQCFKLRRKYHFLGLKHATCHKKLKLVITSIEFQNNCPASLFKTIFKIIYIDLSLRSLLKFV